MNNKKEGEYYSQMVRRYKNEYGGKNLQEFCIKEKISYTKVSVRILGTAKFGWDKIFF